MNSSQGQIYTVFPGNLKLARMEAGVNTYEPEAPFVWGLRILDHLDCPQIDDRSLMCPTFASGQSPDIIKLENLQMLRRIYGLVHVCCDRLPQIGISVHNRISTLKEDEVHSTFRFAAWWKIPDQ